MDIKTNGTQKETRVVDIQATNRNQVMHYRVDYDTLNPVDTIRNFVSDVKKMLKRYEDNDKRLQEIELQINDLEHFMEIAPNQSVPKGYKLYKALSELRRERRACKNENDMLRPVYDYFHATTVLGRISNVYGDALKNKNCINGRCYTVRTAVLDEILYKPEKEPAGISSEQLFGKDLQGEYGSEIKKMMEA